MDLYNYAGNNKSLIKFYFCFGFFLSLHLLNLYYLFVFKVPLDDKEY